MVLTKNKKVQLFLSLYSWSINKALERVAGAQSSIYKRFHNMTEFIFWPPSGLPLALGTPRYRGHLLNFYWYYCSLIHVFFTRKIHFAN